MIPNIHIKDATALFIDQNPWAFRFNPKVDRDYRNIKVWPLPEQP